MINSFQKEYRWLSNFAPVAIAYNDELYESVEAAYQAQKTLNLDERRKFESYSPSKAKKEGAKLPLRLNWYRVRLEIMEDLLRLKFEQEPYRSQLLETKGKELIEGNNWGDTFWGVCDGVGTNHLGRLLMKIREEIK